ncbi:MAG: TIGR04283 family arsenosugar biosynthesis glycosyltransferase [Deltaproteobacteria bacterium]|nr:TIGR04283 family arsenosugar biosynthesis glycosyltransferase [Deltaproteobacteria bacterium]
MKLSIIIPALNEAEILGRALASLKPHPAEVIVVDGGSQDSTIEVARQHTPHILTSRPGRGLQQDVGARQSQGDVFVFLHADTQLPPNYQDLIHYALTDPGTVFGAFFLSIYPSKPTLYLIALMANLRSRLLKVPYGDQTLFVRRSAYFLAGGFKDWPIMEDVDLVRRLNRIGGFKMARGFVQTSARRWRKENPVYTTLRNYSLILRYCMGASPHTLARHYPNLR